MKNYFPKWIGGCCALAFFIIILFSGSGAVAQTVISQNFESITGTPSGWTATSWSNTTLLPCDGTRSFRSNVWTSGQQRIAAPPAWVSNGNDLSVSFDYKIIDFSTTLGNPPTPAGWGEIRFEYSTDGGTTYTPYFVINDDNHVTSSSCANISFTIPGATLPTGNNVRVRWFAQFANPFALVPAPDYYVYLDNISILQEATEPPLCAALTSPAPDATNASANGTLTWSAAAGAPTGYQVIVTQITDGPIEIYNQTLGAVTTVNVGVLQGQTQYEVAIIPFNANGPAEGCTTSTFTTLNPVLCEAPFIVNELPYTTTDNTGNYGDDYSSTNLPAGPAVYPALSTGTLSGSYLNGDDVVYAYTPASNQLINIQIPTGHGTWLGLWVFEGCPFSQTVAFHLASSSTGRAINNLPVFGGTTYYIVISTNPSPQAAAYTLNITEVPVDCPNIPGNIGAPCSLAGFFDTTISADCECVGTPFDCEISEGVFANIGDACDDGDIFTIGTTIDENCGCSGGTTVVFEGCITGTSFGALSPVCGGAQVNTGTNAWTNEFSPITIVDLETEYTFFTSNPNLFLTITDGTNILAFGQGSVNYTPTVAGAYRFYSHLGPDCPITSGSTTAHVRSVLPGACPLDCPALEANIGDACDDGNADTENDTVTADCACVGTPVLDCPALEANIGDACDDGDSTTENDTVTADCACVGTPIVVFDCPALEANVGDACDDGDATTENDTVTADCACVGTPIVVFDCPALEANIGDACDDGDATTENDTVTADCACVGTVVFDCPALEANIGDACDDGNIATEGSTVDANCGCSGGTLVETNCTTDPGCAADTNSEAYVFVVLSDPFCCNNTWDDICQDAYDAEGGLPSDALECQFDCADFLANIGDACDDGDPLTEGSTLDANCDCTGGTPIVFEGCTTGTLFLTLTPFCNAAAAEAAGSWTNEYSNVNVVSGGIYTFTLSNAAYYATITNSTGTEILAFGQQSAEWTSTFDGVVRFYSHAGPNCPTTTGFATSHTRSASLVCPVDCEELGGNIGDACELAGFFNTTISEDCECVGTAFDCEIGAGEYANFGDACVVPGVGPTISELIQVEAVSTPTTFDANPTYVLNIPPGYQGAYDLTVEVIGETFNNSWASEFRVRITDPNGNNVTLNAPGGASDEWRPSAVNATGPLEGSITFEGITGISGIWLVEVRLSFSEGTEINAIADILFDFAPSGEDGIIGDDCLCFVPCLSEGGTLSLDGSRTVCMPDPATGLGAPTFFENAVLTGAAGDNSLWVLTSSSSFAVLGTYATGPNFDLQNLAEGIYRLWHISYRDDVNIDAVLSNPLTSGCWDVSNSLNVEIAYTVEAGSISTNGLTTVCTGQGIPSVVLASYTGPSGFLGRWVLSNELGDVLDTRGANSLFNFDVLAPGNYLISYVVLSAGPNSLNSTSNLNDLGPCASVSNFIEVTAIDCSGTAALSSQPNPTNGVSWVNFQVERGQQVQLEVFDLSGRQIKTLFHQNAEAAHAYTLQFDGSALPNGVYIYKLTTETEVLIDKFMIAR